MSEKPTVINHYNNCEFGKPYVIVLRGENGHHDTGKEINVKPESLRGLIIDKSEIIALIMQRLPEDEKNFDIVSETVDVFQELLDDMEK